VKVFLSYALSLGGLGLIAAAVIGAMLANLSYPQARMNMINMLRTNANKAELLCKTARNTFYEPLGQALKLGAMSQSTDPKIVAMSTKPGFDAGCMPVTMHWKKLMGHGKKGVLGVIGGLALAVTIDTSIVFHVIAVVITAVCAVYFMATKMENERSLLRAKAEILPEVDRAFAEGRYRFSA
jgi:phage shock protein PspC (stress-responsive transcriptional regulator)